MVKSRPLPSVDAVQSKFAFSKYLREKLVFLRARIFRPRILVFGNFLSTGKKILFRWGLILSRDWYRSSFIFFAGAVLIFGTIFFFQTLDLNTRLGKQILGTATTSWNLLQKGEIKLSIQNLESLNSQIQNADSLLLDALGRFSERISKAELVAISNNLIAALQTAEQAFGKFESFKFDWDGETSTLGQNTYRELKAIREDLVKSLDYYELAFSGLTKFDFQMIPGENGQNISTAYAKIAEYRDALNYLVEIQSAILGLLAGEKKTYLLVFQNNNELRATGGFLGTYGLLELQNGEARITRIESIYALDGQLKEIISAPGPLRRQVTQNWGLRDSNWFVDFPQSARKMLEFLEKEGGVLASGVIALTPDVFEDLLHLTGPVAMPEYGVDLTAENFREIVQYKTSIDYDRELNQPKKFLADFAPLLVAKLADLPKGSVLSVFDVLLRAVEKKNLLLFSLDKNLQAQFRTMRADGGILPTEGDYLAIYHSNVGGGKTDQSIKQKVEQDVVVLSDGTAISKLRLTQTHEGSAEQYFPRHVDFLRILVPARAKLISATGFDDNEVLSSSFAGAQIDPDLAGWDQTFSRDKKNRVYLAREAGYAVFANWLELDPGETKTVELVYEVPLSSRNAYTLLLQKQPGALAFDYSLHLRYLAGSVAWVFPAELSWQQDALIFQSQIQTDKFFGVVAK